MLSFINSRMGVETGISSSMLEEAQIEVQKRFVSFQFQITCITVEVRCIDLIYIQIMIVNCNLFAVV